MYRVLIVEDESDIAELIKSQIVSFSDNVTVVNNGLDAKELINKEQFDLFILDWMLPNLTGIDLCKIIRENSISKEASILMVTALAQAENIIKGLDSGADDYITKPFDLHILKARVMALLRRLPSKVKDSNLIELGTIKIDKNAHEARIQNNKINLTATEFNILITLCMNKGKVYSRKQLITEVLGEDVFVTDRTIDTHMAGLRKKIGDQAKLIETIRGVGYRVSV